MFLSSSSLLMVVGLTTQIISTSLGNVLPPKTLLSFYNNNKQADRSSRTGSGPVSSRGSGTIHTELSIATQSQSTFSEHARSHTLERELEVTVDSSYCQLSEGVLNCDFSWSQQEVYVPSSPQTNHTIKELLITNVRHLKLSKAFCSTLILHNVEEVLTVEDSSRPACQTTMIELLNVTLDKLPPDVKSLHATDSKIISFILGESAEVVTVTDSKIQYLRTHAENTKVQIVLHNTVIERVENLQISGTSSLKSFNCSFKNLPGDGIIINATENVMNGVIFPKDSATKNGIVLKGGADLEIGDIKGKIHIKAQIPVTGKQIFHSTYSQEGSLINGSRYPELCSSNGSDYGNNCVDTSHLILIFLIFSLFLNITQILFDQPGKLIKAIVQAKRNPRLTLTEVSEKDDDGDSIHSHEKPLLNEDYLLARRISSLDPLHIRRVSVVDSKDGEVHTVTRVVPHESSGDEHHHHLQALHIPHPHRQEHPAGRIRKRTPQKHGNKNPHHPLKRRFTIAALDMKYYPRRDSLPSHQNSSGPAFQMAVMSNPKQSTHTQTH